MVEIAVTADSFAKWDMYVEKHRQIYFIFLVYTPPFQDVKFDIVFLVLSMRAKEMANTI